jgi:SAM-dependent methyltransferase
MELGQHYRGYWRRMELRAQAERYRAPCLRWYHSETLNPTERVVFERVRAAARLLDFGAGDLRLKRKFLAAGFAGRYETLDVSEEFPHDYTDLGQVQGTFGAILCLEVIEHLPLTAFDSLVDGLCERLEPGGALVVSTPNPLCVVPMWARDSGHIQQYPLHDLLAALLARDLTVEPFRVRFGPAAPSLPQRLRFLSQRVLCYLLAVDYADGLLVIGTRP